MAIGAVDANGIWQYGEDDVLSPFSTLLNKGMGSVSTKLAAMPRGATSTGYKQLVADPGLTSTTATPVDIPGLALTVVAPAGRRWKACVELHMSSTVANNRVDVRMTEDTGGAATIVGQMLTQVSPAGGGVTYQVPVQFIFTLTAGTHTLKTLFSLSGGTGTITLKGALPYNSWALIEDIGPA